MNKPAPKEPSMDEILSSIRQIIADDDVALAPRKPAQAAGEPASRSDNPIAASLADVLGKLEVSSAGKPASPSNEDLGAALPEPAADDGADEPLELSATQIVPDETEGVAEAEPDFSAAFAAVFDEKRAAPPKPESKPITLVDPEDISFEPEAEIPELPSFASILDEPVSAVAVDVEPEPVSARHSLAEPEPAGEQAEPDTGEHRIEDVSPLPDPTLSADLADELLEPATTAAVRHTFARLNGISLSNNQGVTIESMMREMLRPMLKEWLDEHLPAVVERMVEKEISRISRGLE